MRCVRQLRSSSIKSYSITSIARNHHTDIPFFFLLKKQVLMMTKEGLLTLITLTATGVEGHSWTYSLSRSRLIPICLSQKMWDIHTLCGFAGSALGSATMVSSFSLPDCTFLSRADVARMRQTWLSSPAASGGYL